MTPTVKTCFKCKAVKKLTEFYVHPQMGDGRLNKCKECTKKDVRANYEANFDYYKAYEKDRARDPERVAARKDYAQTPEGKAAFARAQREYRARYPERYRAHCAVNNAVRDGRLIKKPCEVCGCKEVHGHHDDYSKPLAVRWLCEAHHLQEHGKEIIAA